MKKVTLLISIIIIFSLSGIAQVNPHALGLRLGGDGLTNGAELSYQHGLSDINRIEFDLGFGTGKNHNRFYVAGIYHWDWSLTGGLNWYIGPGAVAGFHTYDNDPGFVNIAIGGQAGLEYDFNAHNTPLILSLDARPMWNFLGEHNGLGWGASISLRYTW